MTRLIFLLFVAFCQATIFLAPFKASSSETYKSIFQNYIDAAWDYTIAENDSALIYVKKALKIAKENQYSLGEAIAFESQGLYHEIVTGNYDLASKSYFEAINICEKNKLKYVSSIYHALGVMFHTSDNYDKALTYYEIVYERALKDEEIILQKKCLINLGSVYSSLQDYENAKVTMLKSLAIDVNHELDYNIYANLGNLFIRQKQYKKAIPYLEKSVVIHPNNLDGEKNLMYLIEAKAALKDSVDMQPIISRAILEAENITALRAKSNLYNALSKYFYAFDDYKAAADYQKKYHTVFVEIKENQRDKTVYDLETKYQTEKKERELEAKKTNEKLLIISLVFLGVLLSLVTYFFVKNRKKNVLLAQQKNLLESALEDKNVLLKEIHHRVKNNLQVISSLLSLQQRQITDVKASQALQEGRDRVKAMALIHQNLYQDTNIIGVEINDYVTKLANSLVKNYQLEGCDIQLNIHVDLVKVEVDTIIPLGLVINELISNALKYAFTNKTSGEISINMKLIGTTLTLAVADNGKGLPEGFSVENTVSLGFRLIKAFSDKLKAKLDIHSSDKGTRIALQIPNIKAS